MRASRLKLLAPLLISLFLLAPADAPAATLSHPFLGALPTPYEDACGIAFRGGELFVSDYYHDQISGPDVTIKEEDPLGGPCKLAFDPAGDLYVDNWHHDVVKYAAGELLPAAGTVIDSANPTGLAIDDSTGDLYVSHRTYVAKYSSAGALLATIGSGELAEAYGVAVSEFPETAGDIYVADAATETVKVFDSAGAPIGELDGAATPEGHFTYMVDSELALDNSPISPSYGHLFVLDVIGHGLSDQPEAVLDEFNSKGQYRSQITGFTAAEPSGIAINPNSGPSNGNVYVTSGNTEESSVFEYGPTAPAFTLTTAKTGAGGGTISSQPSGIACGSGSACAAEYDQEERVTLVAIPDSHSEFTGWTVTGPGSSPCPGTGTCTLFLFGDTEVTANFEPAPLRKLEVSVAGHGSLSSEPAGLSCSSGTCGEEFAEGDSVVLTAAPAAHNKVAAWSGCDSVPRPDVCEVTMSEAKAVSLTFAPIPQLSLSVAKTGTGQGAVTSYPPGIACPGVCSASFDEGSTVYLMAAPSPGSGFAGFSGAGCQGNATLCAVTMSSAGEVSAQFTGAANGPGVTAATHGSSFKLTTVRTTATAARLTLSASEAGTLLLSGAGLQRSRREIRAGTTIVPVRLSGASLRRLHRRHRLQLRLSIGFLPAAADRPPSGTDATLRFRSSLSKAQARKRER